MACTTIPYSGTITASAAVVYKITWKKRPKRLVPPPRPSFWIMSPFEVAWGVIEYILWGKVS